MPMVASVIAMIAKNDSSIVLRRGCPMDCCTIASTVRTLNNASVGSISWTTAFVVASTAPASPRPRITSVIVRPSRVAPEYAM